MKKQIKRKNDRLDGLQHEIQQSRLVLEAGANGERTCEREQDADTSWENGDTQNTNRGNDFLKMPKRCLIQIVQNRVILFYPSSDRQVTGQSRKPTGENCKRKKYFYW